MPTIVVGVDGSAGSDAALRWALDEARMRGTTVLVVHAYHGPQVDVIEGLVGAAGIAAPAVYSGEDVDRLREAGERKAGRVIEGALERAGPDATAGIEIRREAVDGSASQALIAAGRGAQLLVLGSRGRGGFLGLLLGSVTQQCVHHAPCPVVILPPAEDERSA